MSHDNDNLIEEYLHLPVKVAKIFAATSRWPFPSLIDFDDIVSAGNLGLIDAARKYDAKKVKSCFQAYAMIRIRGSIYDFLRQVSWAPKDIVDASKKTGEPLKTITCSAAISSGEDPDGTIRNSTERGKQKGNLLELKNTYSTDQISKLDNEDAIKYLLKPLSIVEREIVNQYYIGHKTLKQIGKEVGLSEAGVCIKLKAIKSKCMKRKQSLKEVDLDNFNSNLR
jgi:RNA polymerase sigma factor for flagellar operon FliA